MSGDKNFQATQQIFYVSGKQESDNKEDNVTLPDGYVFTPGIGAHKLHLTPKIWSNARIDCVKEGGKTGH